MRRSDDWYKENIVPKKSNNPVQDYIKKMLKESLGVPDNLVEFSDFLFKQLVNICQSGGELFKSHIINGNFNISDFKFKRVELVLEENRQSLRGAQKIFVGDVGFIGNSKLFYGKLNKKDNFNLISEPSEEIKITIEFILDHNYIVSEDDIAEYLKKEKVWFISSFAHELKHAYDYYKNGQEKIMKKVDYKTVAGGSIIKVDGFSKLFYLMYYTHDIENAVRSSELAAEIYVTGISQDGFKDFLVKTEMYKLLKKAKEFSYVGLIKLLTAESISLRKILKDSVGTVPSLEEEVVHNFLELFYGNFLDYKEKYIKLFLDWDPIDSMYKSPKDGFMKKLVQDLTHSEGYEQYFQKEILKMNMTATKVLKKIAGLYALIPKLQKKNGLI